MNNPLATIIRDAFLVALAQLDSPLPPDLQRQLNEMSDRPDADKLDAIAENYPPLHQRYLEAYGIFQDYDSERSRGPIPAKPDEKAESLIGEQSNEVFRAGNSVEAAKQEAEKPSRLSQLLQLIKQRKS